VLILLDVQMPGMDGWTAELIRKRERSRYTPIIFLTAFSTSDNLVFRGYSLCGGLPVQADFARNIDIEGRGVDLFKKTEEVKRQVQIKMQELQVLSQQHEKLIAFRVRWPLDLPMN